LAWPADWCEAVPAGPTFSGSCSITAFWA
jgi:hypothetical protein